MKGLRYQLKNIRRDKMCILTFLLPVIAGIAINLLTGLSLSSVSENTFGIVENDLDAETAQWLESIGNVTMYESKSDLEAAVIDPSTQKIGVLQNDNGIYTVRAGDELKMYAEMGDILPELYQERDKVRLYDRTIIPAGNNEEFLKSLLIVITMVTAMFMGCTFNTMSIISEKEEGIVFVNEVLPMTRTQYIIQKIALGFWGAVMSTGITAVICIKTDGIQVLFLTLIIFLSSFIASLAGLFIGSLSGGLMTGIMYIKIVMIAFIAPPVLIFLAVPQDSILYNLSYILPSSAAFYGLMELLGGQQQRLMDNLIILLIHCILWFFLYAAVSVKPPEKIKRGRI